MDIAAFYYDYYDFRQAADRGLWPPGKKYKSLTSERH